MATSVSIIFNGCFLNGRVELALESGLSSPGRLLDLFVTLEAMSPGEYKAAGAGLKICYGLHESTFGTCLIAMTERGICNLLFLDTEHQQSAEQQLYQEWPNATVMYDQEATGAIYNRIFDTTE